MSSELWTPPAPERTQCYKFMKLVSEKYGVPLASYFDLHSWSIDNVAQFWEEVWYFTNIVASEPFTKVIESADPPLYPRKEWFAGARLNYAQNLLYPVPAPDPDTVAVYEANEAGRRPISWSQLRYDVQVAASAFRAIGLQTGDRVAAFVNNNYSTLVSILAVSSIGAIWSSTSSEIGAISVIDRFSQINPKILIADIGAVYNGKLHNTTDRVAEITAALTSLVHVILVPQSTATVSLADVPHSSAKVWTYDEFIKSTAPVDLVFEQLPFDHPLFILYSSGTTGKPKCIVHGQGGTLLQHKKEHQIHLDLGLNQVFFQYTTCSWMMWQWLISGLASGATIVLYDGSPFVPDGPETLWKLADELKVEVFGTSAKYLTVLEQRGVFPKNNFKLEKLRAITSTGSVLPPSTYDYVYKAFPPLLLASITGGTDILSLFGAPSFMLPVHRGEIQCAGLAMAMEVWDDSGKPAAPNAPGDLVCTKAFPVMPVMFWNDESGERYKASYFETFPGVWHHGDYLKQNPETKGFHMLGRSDGVLKPSGVRFGSSEIYNIIEKFFNKEVEDSLCIGRRRETDDDESVLLFLKMQPGLSFTDDLANRIRATIREDLSARHVPAVITDTPDIPMTPNGKKIETLVKKIVSGYEPKVAGNSVANEECLQWYRDWAKTN
ncbi:hypothetical protein CANCADRAFT_563 [Tortispora caseinolytica NRRL Y-17796]|uniref:AMP-dependent synthetase/ligase domain-containing protein n=1 Tax=Tortispora caseinolytica NRRL Y-17796 TaxID=767744 RepID=A0A1E4TJY3_9ASCO|nr:hypothetical protein CANCADRAFT_563 [Tortispora caseinolytica NRRL Y-17796]